jgi:uncharacterized membrane protein YwzB
MKPIGYTHRAQVLPITCNQQGLDPLIGVVIHIVSLKINWDLIKNIDIENPYIKKDNKLTPKSILGLGVP